MEELSKAAFAQLSYDQQQAYLSRLFDEISTGDEMDDEDNGSEDEWIPPRPLGVQGVNDLSDVEDAYNASDIEIELHDEHVPDEYEPNEESDTDEEILSGNVTFFPSFTAKDGTVWSQTPPAVTRIQKPNIFRHKPGPVASKRFVCCRHI